MAMLSTNNTQSIIDKLARFASEAVGDAEFTAGFNAGFETASANVFSGSGGISTLVLALNDLDQVADLLPAARDLDEQHPTPPTGFLLTVKEISAMLTALDTHFKRYGYAGLDSRLTALNASVPTLRAHGFFRRYLGKITAANSFIPSDIAIASLLLTGATAGTYTHLSSVDKTQYAGAQLMVKNVGAITATTAVSITAKNVGGTTTTLTASVSVLTDGHETALSDTAKLYVDVTAIAVTGGTSGNQINIIAKTDRSVTAA